MRRPGIRFSDAEAVLFDPSALIVKDHGAVGDQRSLSVGTDNRCRVVVVVYTYRDEHIRLISARTATPNERKAYEEGI